jgi:hypothetical protein
LLSVNAISVDLQQLSSNYSLDPQPLMPGYKLAVPENGMIEIFCERPVGLPTPRLWWEGPNGKVISSTQGTSTSPGDSGTIILQNVKSDQAGNYTCVAENLENVTRASFQLVVLTSKPVSYFSSIPELNRF